jgi:hypothetical protein
MKSFRNPQRLAKPMKSEAKGEFLRNMWFATQQKVINFVNRAGKSK